MALELNDLKERFDKAFVNSSTPRELGAEDIVFFHVSQWTDDLLQDAQLAYRGQFDIIRKGFRQVMADLRENPVQVDFDPKDPEREDGADFLDGLYRSDDRLNSTQEAYTNAQEESGVCGVGAWELYTAYEEDMIGDERQVIRRDPLYEANSTVFWDPNAKMLDKADAKWVAILKTYSVEGYCDLVEFFTGDRPPKTMPSDFKQPEHSYTFPWFGDERKVYVVTFYTLEEVTEKILKLNDPFGGNVHVREEDVETLQDELIDAGYTVEDTIKLKRKRVFKYIATGDQILTRERIAGKHIPVVPLYGERAIVEGVEYWSGLVRPGKDPQKLHNFQMSYLADIVSRSPRQKPIFTPEQIQGHEDMYDENGADNNYPYLLQNMYDGIGSELPLGPVGQLPAPEVPQALMASIELTRRAVDDVVSSGNPDSIADIELSGKAISNLQARFDQQSIVYQKNMRHAKRRDGEIYAAMAAEVYDAPRQVTLTRPDGSSTKQTVMDTVIDQESGEIKTINDITNLEFEVFSSTSKTYESKKTETIDQLTVLYQNIPPEDPLKQSILLKTVELMDGIDLEDVRAYARRQLLISGFTEPKTPEEQAMVQQAQQAAEQQPDPAMEMAKAEQMKGEAEQQMAEARMQEAQVKLFDAQTKRMAVQVSAEEAGMKISDAMKQTTFKRDELLANIRSQQVDNLVKLRGSAQKDQELRVKARQAEKTGNTSNS